MRVVEKLKLNKFCLVKLPKNDVIFARYGNYIPSESSYSGDVPIEPFMSKIDSISQANEDFEVYCADCEKNKNESD